MKNTILFKHLQYKDKQKRLKAKGYNHGSQRAGEQTQGDRKGEPRVQKVSVKPSGMILTLFIRTRCSRGIPRVGCLHIPILVVLQ